MRPAATRPAAPLLMSAYRLRTRVHLICTQMFTHTRARAHTHTHTHNYTHTHTQLHTHTHTITHTHTLRTQALRIWYAYAGAGRVRRLRAAQLELRCGAEAKPLLADDRPSGCAQFDRRGGRGQPVRGTSQSDLEVVWPFFTVAHCNTVLPAIFNAANHWPESQSAVNV